MVGVPASGKTTFAKNLAKKSKLEILDADEIKRQYRDKSEMEIFEIIKKKLKKLLSEKQNVIVDMPNAFVNMRKKIIEISRKAGAKKIICIWMKPPLNTCIRRHYQRLKQGRGPAFPVTTDTIKTHYRALEEDPPKLSDGFDMIFRKKGLNLNLIKRRPKMAEAIELRSSDVEKTLDLLKKAGVVWRKERNDYFSYSTVYKRKKIIITQESGSTTALYESVSWTYYCLRIIDKKKAFEFTSNSEGRLAQRIASVYFKAEKTIEEQEEAKEKKKRKIEEENRKQLLKDLKR
ncbi:MAG: ATP-binding protein [Patescibacteria group bacterium]|nr:ATP-binding protein [Patescibacteria group bacterium]MDD5164081.1 ATP-binding protein [Patescibacteria group bacterium]MDD5534261.1 ATP-binding protein [Patescibacteria group bacterium]